MVHTAKRTVIGRRGKNKAATKARTSGKKEKSELHQTAIVPVTPPVTAIQGKRERTLRAEEIELLKNTVAKGTTNDEFLYFMTICRKHRIDPFTKQIYCVVWPTDSGKSHDLVIIMGIGGYRMTAARDHKDFAGTSSATFTWPETKLKTPAGRPIPESATVKAIRKGGEVSEATCYWDEFAPRDLTAKRSDFWNRMPRHMLAKCAEAHAIRKAFPDLSDIYTEEEVSQKIQGLSPGGRQIVDSKGFSSEGVPVTHEARGNVRVEQEVERQKQEYQQSKTPKQFAGTIEIDHSRADEVSRPSIHCSSQEILELVKSKCSLVWGKGGFWHPATGKDYGIIRTICDQNNFEFVEIVPSKPNPPKASGTDRRPENKAAQTGKSSSQRGETQKKDSAGPRLVTGARIQVCQTHTSANKKTPYMTMLVKIGTRATWMDTWDHTFFMWFTKAKEYSVDCGIYIKDNPKYNPQIVGIQYIGDIKFRDDMKTPIKPDKKQSEQEGLFK